MFKNYDGLLKIDGEVGNKKVYDPRSYLKKGLAGMQERVAQAVKDLRGVGAYFADLPFFRHASATLALLKLSFLI